MAKFREYHCVRTLSGELESNVKVKMKSIRKAIATAGTFNTLAL